MEGWIERALFDAEDFTGDVLDGGHDGVTVEVGAAEEDFQDQEVKGTLEVLRWSGRGAAHDT
jgi:hypothetical protein